MPFPVDDKFVRAAEEKLGVTFPAAFRAGICAMNGGTIDTGTDSWRLFPVFDTSDKKRLKRTANDITRETQTAKSWPDFPDNAVAIGTDDFGNLLVMVPMATEQGQLEDRVYAWDHETGDMRIASPTVEILMNSRR